MSKIYVDKEAIKVGTVFVGNVNKAKFKVIKLEKDNANNTKVVVFADLNSGRVFHASIDTFCRCNISIVKQ